ncbi:DUF4150 domain-containing protein [Thioclava litoralis]|uniref:DUF4150 domain-containing protein n=1 Tax=Thioclava litoralis TaxID=3076557 RepID=A0ABZ1DZ76_9RHOB|nr:DUF4150 domain-containing protein [Thioclava sp. FTW29]
MIPKEGSRDTSEGLIVSCTPDVCKTPVGSSMVPIPYSITSKQGDDANTATTVRYTSQRAHNMGSMTTCCTGDAPGTGTGVKSGTVGSICEPKTHSGTVRIEGKWAVRHTDEWWMNKRNTVGKLTYVKSSETFEPTPAVKLAQNPELEAPNALKDTYVDAIWAGMKGAEQEGLPEGSYRVAQAATVMPDIPYVAPDSTPKTNIPAPSTPAANTNSEPNRIVRESLMRRIFKRLELAAAANPELSAPAATGSAAVGAATIGVSRAAGRNAQQQKGGGLTPFLNLNAPYEIDPPWLEAEVATAPQPQVAPKVESQRTEENVSVAQGNKKPGGGNPCNFHKHSEKQCPEGYQSHHIIQDMFFRIGGRKSLERPNGAPTIGEGEAICIRSKQHRILHKNINDRLKEIGKTANLFDLADISADELKKLLKRHGLNCDKEIDKILKKFKDSLGERGKELLGRVKRIPGSAAEQKLRDSWFPPQ